MSYNAEAFHKHVEAGNLAESYGVSEVVIQCGHCAASWARGRRRHRADTIYDRDQAVQHLRQHEIYDAPPAPEAS